MKRTPLILAAILLLLPSFTLAREASWAEVVKRVFPSVVEVQRRNNPASELTGHEGIASGVTPRPMQADDAIATICTGFIINKIEDYAMTAYHCLNEGTDKDVFVDGEPARLVWSSKDLDAAILSVKTRKPALKRSLMPLEWGTPVATLGYGYGFGPLFRAGYVAHPNVEFPQAGYPGAIWFLFDSTFIGGMSGGPVFGVNGKVVSLVQMGDNDTGLGRPIGDIYTASAQYWQ